MARSADPDSAGSQFFICVADAPFLDRQYTAFGQVTSGMEVADKIVSQPRDKQDNPLERVEIKVQLIEKQPSK
jgi:cyclophilin family peptidyl-prolyl cis-trans isomerase